MDTELTIGVILCLSVILFFGYFEQQVTGFGATVFCLPFALLLIPREIFTPVGWFFTFAQSIYILIRQRNKVNKKLLLISLILAGSLGTLLGNTVVAYFPSRVIKICLAIFIVGNSLFSIYRSRREAKQNETLKLWHYLFPIGSGAMQASYGIGGPLLVVFLAKPIHDKDELRSTLAGYWVFLNGFLLLQSLATTGIPTASMELWLFLTPSVILGMVLGNLALKKLDPKHFSLLINIVLILASFLLLF